MCQHFDILFEDSEEDYDDSEAISEDENMDDNSDCKYSDEYSGSSTDLNDDSWKKFNDENKNLLSKVSFDKRVVNGEDIQCLVECWQLIIAEVLQIEKHYRYEILDVVKQCMAHVHLYSTSAESWEKTKDMLCSKSRKLDSQNKKNEDPIGLLIFLIFFGLFIFTTK